jgi:hypothetical protein
MPVSNIFQQLRDRITKSKGLLPLEQRAMYWFRDYASELTQWQKKLSNQSYQKMGKETFSKQIVSSTSAYPGCFYFYMYDPKGKNTLPFYDRFPFTLVLRRDSDSFLGLNFHYLDYYHRALLFDAIYPYRDGRTAATTTLDIRSRILISYDILQASSKYKYFRPTIKRYLNSHIQTPLMKVGASEWDVALFLPVEMFVKETKQNVWKNSEQKFT